MFSIVISRAAIVIAIVIEAVNPIDYDYDNDYE
jgi:hypothetical protein